MINVNNLSVPELLKLQKKLRKLDFFAFILQLGFCIYILLLISGLIKIVLKYEITKTTTLLILVILVGLMYSISIYVAYPLLNIRQYQITTTLKQIQKKLKED